MEEKNENVVEETTQENVTKVKIKNIKEEDNVTKVNLDKPVKPVEENETKENNADNSGVVAESKDTEPTEKQEEVQPKDEAQESVLEEVTENVEEIATEAETAIKENLETGKPLPENIQKLVDFIEETGGDLNDYVKLNQDYSNLDDVSLLKEYYKQTKKHLDSEEINFLIEDQFSYDEENDEEKDIKRKKLALKEQVAT